MNTMQSQQWQHIHPESGMGSLSLCDLSLERPDYRTLRPFVCDDGWEEY